MNSSPLFLYCQQDSKWNYIPRIHLEKSIDREYSKTLSTGLSELTDLEKCVDDITSRNKSEICWSLCFHPSFITRLFFAGFLPICCNIAEQSDPLWVLLPKMHYKRCILYFNEFHVSKKVRKAGSKYDISINSAFGKVLNACRDQHGESCWLYPPLLNSLNAINHRDEEEDCVVRIFSVELWAMEAGNSILVAGEIGCLCGSVYTSLTGFSNRNYESAGKVQLTALAEILRLSGVRIWDFGMFMEYKGEIGAHEIHRREFVHLFRSLRKNSIELKIQGKNKVKTLIDSLISWQKN